MTSCDPLTGELLAAGPYRREPAPWGLLQVDGRDATDFLQRLCTQDVAAQALYQLRPAAFLDGRGKLQVTCWVARTGEALWLEAQAHQIDRLLTLLDRYHFSEQVQFRATPEWSCVEWLAAALPNGMAAGSARVLAGGGLVVAAQRRGVAMVRAHGPAAALAGDAALATLAGKPLSGEVAECLRMGAGLVKVGVDTEPGTLALEADLDDHCSKTKGCYTGQEIVARISTYGHVNRRLCLLHLQGEGAIDSPQPLVEPEDGVAVGRVMHAVQAPGRKVRVGLGYLPQDFWAIGSKLQLGQPGGHAVEVVGFGS